MTITPCVEILPECSFQDINSPRNHSFLITLFQQLSHYLDITEVNLAHQISLRSEDFFSAMASQDQLQDHVGETVSEIKHLR